MQPMHCKIYRHTGHDVRCEHTYHTLSYGHCMLHPDARKCCCCCTQLQASKLQTWTGGSSHGAHPRASRQQCYKSYLQYVSDALFPWKPIDRCIKIITACFGEWPVLTLGLMYRSGQGEAQLRRSCHPAGNISKMD